MPAIRLAFDLPCLEELLTGQSRRPGAKGRLSAHTLRAVKRRIGDNPDPVRAGAILSRAMGQQRLVLDRALIQRSIIDLLDVDTVDLDEDEDAINGMFLVASWADGPTRDAARARLAPLFAVGATELGRDVDERTHVLTPEDTIVPLTPTLRNSGDAFHPIVLEVGSHALSLQRDLTGNTVSAAMVALKAAQAAGTLDADMVFFETPDGLDFERADHAAQLARMDEIVHAATGVRCTTRRS